MLLGKRPLASFRCSSMKGPRAMLCFVAQPWRATGSSVHGDSPGKNTGVDCYALLQGIFPTQGSNPGLPHSRRILRIFPEPPGKSKNTGTGSLSLLWAAYPFSRGSSRPRTQTRVSCIAGGFFTS